MPIFVRYCVEFFFTAYVHRILFLFEEKKGREIKIKKYVLMIFNDYHSYIASILNKKLIINRINDVKVLLANTSTLICCS